MVPQIINNSYWSNLPPEKILSGVHFPGKELDTYLSTGKKVLDVGCGIGKVSEYLIAQGCVVTGIDLNQDAIKSAQATHKDHEFHVADVTKPLPFADDLFDVIVVSYVFVSLIDDEQIALAIHELLRVLKKGGVVWLCEATYSPEYLRQYEIGKQLSEKDMVAASFVKNELGEDTDDVKRFIRHFKTTEFDVWFVDCEKLYQEQITKISPSSGKVVESIISMYKK